MKSGVMFWSGIVGTVVTAVCCFTPALVALLVPLGLSALLAWSDLVLLPLLAVFVVVTVVALVRRRGAT